MLTNDIWQLFLLMSNIEFLQINIQPLFVTLKVSGKCLLQKKENLKILQIHESQY